MGTYLTLYRNEGNKTKANRRKVNIEIGEKPKGEKWERGR